MKKTAQLLLSMLFFQLAAHAQGESLNVNAGIERWAIKTSVLSSAPSRNATIDALLSLPNPIASKTQASETARIPKTVNGLKEGDMVTITAWLELVALEDDAQKHRDGDYHIQLRNSPEWADSCLVVEIPYPDFITDPNLKSKCMQARQFILSKLLNNAEPSKTGSKMQHQVYVKVTGQLFFDAVHMSGPPRGKKGMHSYTCWELHPVTSIAFAPKPAAQ